MEGVGSVNKQTMWEELLNVVASIINSTTDMKSTDKDENHNYIDNVTSNEGDEIMNKADLETSDNKSHQSEDMAMETEHYDVDQELQSKPSAVQSIPSSYLQITDTLTVQDNKHIEGNTFLDQCDKQDVVMVNERQRMPESRRVSQKTSFNNHNIKIIYNISPIYLLEEQLKRTNKNTKLSFELIAISINEPGDKFTYMCYVNKFAALGEGRSMKEAMENAAVKLYEKYFIENKSITDVILNITSVNGNTDIEVYQYYETVVSIKQIFHLIDIAESKTGNPLEHLFVRVHVKNPKETTYMLSLNTSYKWTLPMYDYQLLFTLDEYQEHIRQLLTKIYDNTCQIFHFQTTVLGPGINEIDTKQLAINEIFEQMYNIGMDKLNKFKSLQLKFTLLNTEFDYGQYYLLEKISKLSSEWNIAQILRTYITIMNITGQYKIVDNLEELEKIRNQTEMELEKCIKQYNPGSSAVNQLKSMCQKLGIYTFYSPISDLQYQQQNKLNLPSKLNYDHTVLLQVNTLPVIVTIGRATTKAMASENAAKYALHILNEFWYLNS